MLYKINKIENVGRFRSYAGGYPDEVLFKKLTVIYGSNGSGKTTLAAICRSMTSGEPGGMVKRKSAIQYLPNSIELATADTSNQAVPTLQSSQRIEILDYDKTVYKFEKEKWSKIYPNIQTFDSHFCQKFFASPKPPLSLFSDDRFTTLRNETKTVLFQHWDVLDKKSPETKLIGLSDEVIQEQKKKVEGE
jgi:wobble nucleotide-excising tRNase